MDLLRKDGQFVLWWGNDDFAYLYEREEMVKPIITNFAIETTNGLDIGCGKRKSLPLAIGVDQMRGFTEAGVILESFAKPDIICDAKDLIFKDETIDWITASHVIEHFENPIDVINEWLRVLKPGGYISMIVPIAEFTGKIGDPRTDMTHKHDYSIDSFRKEVVDKVTNVEVLDYRYLNNNWSFLCVLKKNE